MDIRDHTVFILGGAGLVGGAVARRIAAHRPRRLVLASLREEEATEAVAALKEDADLEGVDVRPAWGDVFMPDSMKDESWSEVARSPERRGRLLDEIFGELTDEIFERSALGRLLQDVEPDIVVDCVNTAGVLAYQSVFDSAEELRAAAARGDADPEAVERHLGTLYLPKLIRHVQIALEGMKRARTEMYVKVGTSGTGGMGLNIPFTHSEERPSRVLLAKAGLAGAHTLLLYLMARTPGAPAVKEVKPTAAISWKSIGVGPIRKGGRTVERVDAGEPLEIDRAFADGAGAGCRRLGRPLEGVYLDAGENGLFTSSEFETLTSLGLMEFVTPEEVAEAVLREIRGHPTGLDIVTALDAATMGPTYRAGVLRSAVLKRMEELEREAGFEPVAYEMLGPPRVSKLLFEAAILRRLHGDLDAAANAEPERTAAAAEELLTSDDDLRQRIVSIGLPILLADGRRVLRGPDVKVPPPSDDRPPAETADRGWVDLRPESWARWKRRARSLADDLRTRAGVDAGSRSDHEYGDTLARIRPGRLVAWVLRYEDEGERIKR